MFTTPTYRRRQTQNRQRAMPAETYTTKGSCIESIRAKSGEPFIIYGGPRRARAGDLAIRFPGRSAKRLKSTRKAPMKFRCRMECATAMAQADEREVPNPNQSACVVVAHTWSPPSNIEAQIARSVGKLRGLSRYGREFAFDNMHRKEGIGR